FQLPGVIQTSKRFGMITLNDALIEYVNDKLVEPKEAYMKAVEKVGFLNQLKQHGHDVSFIESEEGMSGGGGPGDKPGGAKPGEKTPPRPPLKR
ncbi:MAG: hypothetical protein HY275_11385, partial [Gemmatimonadetes bacterium]|nr:hypothetical protein [Gemmatimonadota bacterium]